MSAANTTTPLVDSLRNQCSSNTYDFDSNIALLRQLLASGSPAADLLALIFAKALMALPEAHVALCRYMLPDSLYDAADSASIRAICEACEALESADFATAWTLLSKLKNVTSSIVGFDDAIRVYVLGVMRLAFSSVKLSDAATFLGVASVADARAWMTKFAAAATYSIEGEVLRFVREESKEDVATKGTNARATPSVEQFAKAVQVATRSK
jgi:hypothetical protein